MTDALLAKRPTPAASDNHQAGPHHERKLERPRAQRLMVPAQVARADDKTQRRFLEFFAATIRNKNTRLAYYRAVCKFFAWCEARGVQDLAAVEPLTMAAFIEAETDALQAQTVKQELAAIRKLFDYLVTGQIVPVNPAASVRGPSYSIDVGKTPVLSGPDARRLLDSIAIQKKDGKPDLAGLRDRALIGLVVYSFARVSAVVNMKVSDYRQDGKKFKAEEYIDEYVAAAGFGEDKKSPLWRCADGKSGRLTDQAISRVRVFKMIKRRAQVAGVALDIGCHTFRATGITAYLLGGGTVESAQQLAKHKSPRTTKLYDRRGDKVTLMRSSVLPYSKQRGAGHTTKRSRLKKDGKLMTPEAIKSAARNIFECLTEDERHYASEEAPRRRRTGCCLAVGKMTKRADERSPIA